ncbi:hypothetical protein FQA39_LY01062 [Lamprigera yunnana]|nr:hypothetical protein FQA39_LY01062 [Lamprigera yunnana]
MGSCKNEMGNVRNVPPTSSKTRNVLQENKLPLKRNFQMGNNFNGEVLQDVGGKNIVYSTSGPPVWEFENEKLSKKIEKAQRRAIRGANLATIEDKKHLKQQFAEARRKLLSCVGPSWFQELSPNQLKTVDNLQACIIQDRRCECIENTKANIGQLGLVLRPYSGLIKIALNHCCECPVEFLLILYQLINEKRTKYSINDRLLLSAVVHLTIKETLRELHVRIPSPPRCKCECHKPPTPSPLRRPRYKSPYLEPFNFVPCPRKHYGIYEKPYRQYPTSPYFSYIPELYREREMISPENHQNYLYQKQWGITDEQHVQIVTELQSAQNAYCRLVCFRPVPYLLKPTVYIPRYGGEIRKKKRKKKKEISISVAMKVTKREDMEDICECNVMVKEDIVGSSNVKTNSGLEGKFIMDGTKTSVDSSCREFSSVPSNVSPYTCPATCLNACSSLCPTECPDICLSVGCRNCDDDIIEDVCCECNNDDYVDEDMCSNKPIDCSSIDDECKCKEIAEKIIEANICQCNLCKKYRALLDEREKLKQEFEKFGKGCSEYLTDADIPNPGCDCLKKYRERIKLYEMAKLMFAQPFIIKCDYAEDNECENTLSLCNSDDKRFEIICDLHDDKRCKCLKLYEEFEERHLPCLESYNEYLEKVKKDVTEYMEEVQLGSIFDHPEVILKYDDSLSDICTETCKDEEEICCPEDVCANNDVECICACSIRNCNYEQLDTCECGCENEGQKELNICDCCGLHESVEELDRCECIHADENQEIGGISVICMCEEPPICHCQPVEYPCYCLPVSEALTIMAEDGFPLAKLPNCWKLPIFKLWMQKRCGKCWTLEDVEPMWLKSKTRWTHLTSYSVRPREGYKIKMCPKRAKNFNCSSIKAGKKILSDKNTSFYRGMRQSAIDCGREFFPGTFSYEFPFPSFRDCYFAYMPDKEEACIFFRVWDGQSDRTRKRKCF